MNSFVIVLLVISVNVVNSERFTSIYYRQEPFGNLPLARSRKYRVYEGEEDIRQDSAGHKLRFAYNPHIAKSSSLHPIALEDVQVQKEFKQYQPSIIRPRLHPREDIGNRYGFRPLLNREIPHLRRSEFVIQRPILGRKRSHGDPYMVEHSLPPLYYARRPLPFYYTNDPYVDDPHINRRIPQENILEYEHQPKELQVNDNIYVRLAPIHGHEIRKYPNMVYSPAYGYGKDISNPIPSSSHLPEYISDVGRSDNHLFYSPGFKHGESSVEKSHIDKEKKKISEDEYHEEGGKKKEEFLEDEQKFKKDEEKLKHKSSDSGHYVNEEVKKKNVEDQEKYDGGKSFKQEEQNENEKKNKSSHKKGHIVRSFKNSHHKEETGNNEEYYDEEHDTGDSFKFDASAGHFGENKAESYKGDHEQNEYAANEKVNKGSHDSAETSEKHKEDKNENKESKEESNSKHYGNRNFKDEESLLGRQESKRLYEEQPQHTPIHRHL